MASLNFQSYQAAFLRQLGTLRPDFRIPSTDTDVIRRTYRWDDLEVASFKYLFNFLLEPDVQYQIVKALFEEFLGQESSFSKKLYLSWEEAKQMQTAGMIMGGHSHEHRSLSSLSQDELLFDLTACQSFLSKHLQPQDLWPFSYPYGKTASFTHSTVDTLKRLGFDCSFTTEIGDNKPGTDLFFLQRIDCKDV
jgi:hypothetical protein